MLGISEDTVGAGPITVRFDGGFRSKWSRLKHKWQKESAGKHHDI